MLGNPESEAAPRRRQWHRVYYGLALFDVLVVGLGLFLNHQIIDTYDEATRVNQVWENRLDGYLDLGTSAGAVNAPGNDIFDSRDVRVEKARRDQALRRFEAQIATIRADLENMSPQHAKILRGDLQVLEERMSEMNAEADLIFGYFDQGRPDLAGSRMAAMDRRYHDVNAAITQTREDVGEIQRDLFREQADHAEDLRDFEFLIAGFVIVMISMATGYGHRIKKEMERRDAERARYVAELETSHERLAHANSSLTDEVSARVQAEASLRLSEERYALAARGANDGLWDWDLQVGEVYFSPRWKALLGYADDELGTRPGEWLDRVHPGDRDELRGRLRVAIDTGEAFEIEHRVLHRDGGYRWMMARGVATCTGESRRLVGSHSDVTARKEAELNLAHDSLHDGLTGLPNRALFLDRLDLALRRGQRSGEAPFAAIYVDLDRFKQVNDSLGHPAGDELLIRFAELLQQVIRPGDTAARLGGDEFALLLENMHSEEEARTVAQRILTELEQPIHIDETEVYASASIGIALGQSVNTTTAQVLRHADAALYRAKRDGRGRLEVFEPGRFGHLVADPRLEIDLRGAIARSELDLLFQPIVKLGTEEFMGVEALVRWTHPLMGAVPPSTFIPIAEESGDIAAIGAWVLREACRSVAGLSEPLFVSVNVSPHQLLRDDFVSRVLTMLSETGLEAGRLHLEITENSVVRDREHATRVLQQLRDLEVKVCIDDFGTGHSALAYIHDLPVDGIKIDRSFVSRLNTSDNGAYMIGVLLDLAAHNGMTAIAEGVETEPQKLALLQLECEYAQGYLFDQPLTLDALVERLESVGERAS